MIHFRLIFKVKCFSSGVGPGVMCMPSEFQDSQGYSQKIKYIQDYFIFYIPVFSTFFMENSPSFRACSAYL